MLGISFLRVLRAASQNFWRNIWLSVATTAILTITLLMMSFLYFANVLGGELIRTIEQKVDLSAQFRDNIPNDQIQLIADEIASRQDVEDVRIVTSQQALDQFRQRHQDDPLIEESLQELESNPLPASIYVVATEPRFYQNIAKQLQAEKYQAFIEKVNFENSRAVIDRLISVMSTVKSIGFVITITFAILVVLIMFNTIRLAIYSFREEIDIMRLVGASNWFIRGPFVMEAIMVALLSVVISSAILYPVLSSSTPQLQRFFFEGRADQFNLYQYALTHWLTVVGLQATLAVILATLSSMFAIRRYLKR